MSAAERIARTTIAASAALLPGHLRERYREQWMADLRDAAEAGLRPSQIARGAVAFSLTVARPWPALSPWQIERRSRLAVGLSLAAALLGLSQYASIIPDRDFSGNPPDYGSLATPISIAMGLLFVLAVIGAVFGVLLALATRGVDRRRRAAVILLALASCAPLGHAALARTEYGDFGEYLRPSALVYLLGALFVAFAIGLLWRSRRRPRVTRARRAPALVSGLIVALAIGCGSAAAAMIWASRRPLLWISNSADGPARLSNPNYAEWTTLKTHIEGTLSTTFVWWAVAGVVLGIAVAVAQISARLSRNSAIFISVGALCGALIAEAALLADLEVTEAGTVPLAAITLLFILGRLGIVAVVIVGASEAGRGRSISPAASNSFAT